jgi:hypothetical protein
MEAEVSTTIMVTESNSNGSSVSGSIIESHTATSVTAVNSRTVIVGSNSNFNNSSAINSEANASGSYSVTVAGNDTQVILTNPANIGLVVNGWNDMVLLSDLGGGSVDDRGTNLLLQISGGPTGTLVMRDFQSDLGGILELSHSGYTSTEQALAALKPDGSGGTVLPMNTGGQVDFVGETAQQLSGHILVGTP